MTLAGGRILSRYINTVPYYVNYMNYLTFRFRFSTIVPVIVNIVGYTSVNSFQEIQISNHLSFIGLH